MNSCKIKVDTWTECTMLSTFILQLHRAGGLDAKIAAAAKAVAATVEENVRANAAEG